MPIGVADFKNLMEKDYYFVDKTKFIKDIWDKHSKVTLITRPRRFGKTLNLSMLKYFFTLDNAAENRKLFHGLAIEQYGEQYMRQQGAFPVVFLTFKDVKYGTWQGQRDITADILSNLYQRHLFLLDSSALNKYDKKFIENMCELHVKQSNISRPDREKPFFGKCWKR